MTAVSSAGKSGPPSPLSLVLLLRRTAPAPALASDDMRDCVKVCARPAAVLVSRTDENEERPPAN